MCKTGRKQPLKIWLSRHGESEYSKRGILGGDSSLTSEGQRYASALPGILSARLPQGQATAINVWTSTLKRTIQTAEGLPFPKLRLKALDEIDAGVCEGMTYVDMAERMPEEFAARKRDKLSFRYPSGESYLDVIQRLQPVIREVEQQEGLVCIVAHQAVLRCLYSHFMGLPLEQVPHLSIPLHTLMELTPMPDETMSMTYIPMDGECEPQTMPPQQQQQGQQQQQACSSAAAFQPGVSADTPADPSLMSAKVTLAVSGCKADANCDAGSSRTSAVGADSTAFHGAPMLC